MSAERLASHRFETALTSLALCTALLTFGSQNVQFYAYWAVAVSTLGFGTLLVALRGYLSRAMLKLVLLIAGWTLIALIVTPFVTNLRMHLMMMALTVVYAVFASTIVWIMSANLRALAATIFWCTSLWAVINLALLVAFTLGIIGYEGRAFSGVYYNRNTLAVVGLILFLLNLGLRDWLAAVLRGVLWQMLLACLAVLILATLSTKGLFGLLLIFGSVVWFRTKGATRLVTVLVVPLALAVVMIAGGPIGDRVAQKVSAIASAAEGDAEVGASGYQRLWLILNSVQLIAERPLTGVGVHNSQFHLFTERYYYLLARGDIEPGSVGVYSHTNYTEMLLNAGVFAFLAYYAPLLVLWRRARATRVYGPHRRLRWMVLAGIALKLFLDIGMVSYYEFSHLFLTALLWGIYLRYLKVARVSSAEKSAAPVSGLMASG